MPTPAITAGSQRHAAFQATTRPSVPCANSSMGLRPELASMPRSKRTTPKAACTPISTANGIKRNAPPILAQPMINIVKPLRMEIIMEHNKRLAKRTSLPCPTSRASRLSEMTFSNGRISIVGVCIGVSYCEKNTVDACAASWPTRMCLRAIPWNGSNSFDAHNVAAMPTDLSITLIVSIVPERTSRPMLTAAARSTASSEGRFGPRPDTSQAKKESSRTTRMDSTISLLADKFIDEDAANQSRQTDSRLSAHHSAVLSISAEESSADFSSDSFLKALKSMCASASSTSNFSMKRPTAL
mmetsp:Transcript_58301/g.112507  ORF Transcript_58301/g.112507 Transcript_58301/m.112507 type:complete len:299 (-) Transcript_58301:1176-2072(-)